MTSIIVLSKWHSWLQSVIDCFAGWNILRKTRFMRGDLESGGMESQPRPNYENTKSRMSLNHTATWSVRKFMGFLYSPLRDSDRGQLDLGRFPETPTAYPTAETINLNVHSNTEITRSTSCFLRAGQLIYNLSLSRLFTTLNNRVKRMLRPQPKADKQRIEWTCVSNS